MTSTNYYYSSSEVDGIIEGIMAIFGTFMLIGFVVGIILLIAQWKIFKKNNKPGWYSLIPILNMWTLFEIVGVKGWLSLIPGVNVIFLYVVNYKLPIKMGRSKAMGILNIFFPYIVYPILAFSKDKEVRPNNMPEIPQYQQNEQPVQQNYSNPVDSAVGVAATQSVQPAVETNQNYVRRCPNCNTELSQGSLFCHGCGRKNN